MKNTNFISVIVLMLFITTSCVIDNDYSVDNIKELDKEMTFFGNGMRIPLGETEPISLGEIMDSANDSTLNQMLHKTDAGDYSFRYADNYALADQINALDLKTAANLDAVTFEQDISFEINNIGDDVKVNGRKFDTETQIGQIDMDALKLPEPNVEPSVFKTEIAKYLPDDDDLGAKCNLPDYSTDLYSPLETIDYNDMTMTIVEAASLLAAGNKNATIDIQPILNATGNNLVEWEDSYSQELDFKIDMDSDAEGVANLDNFMLCKGGSITATLMLENAMFTDGEGSQNISVDIGNIFSFTGGDGIMDLSDLKLSADNGWTSSKKFNIASLNQNAIKYYRESGILAVRASVFSKEGGCFTISKAKTTLNKLESVGDKAMKLKLSIAISDVYLESMDVELGEVTYIFNDVSIPVDFSAELPEDVSSVNSITLDRTKPLKIEIQAQNLSGMVSADRSSHLSIKPYLELTIPQGIKVENSGFDNKITLEGELFDGKISQNIIATELFPVCSGNKVSFSGNIECKVKAVASGKFNTANIPSGDKDLTITSNVTGSLEISDFTLSLNEEKIAGRMEVSKTENFSFELKDMDDFGSFSVTPKGSPKIELEIDVPELEETALLADNIRIHIPEMIVVDPASITGLAGDNRFDKSGNDIVLKGKLPSKVSLPVSSLHITPVKDKEGKLIVSGDMTVSGGMKLETYDISKKTVDAINGKSIKLSGSIPDMEAERIALEGDFSKSLDTEIKDVVILDGNALKDIPSEIKKIASMELDGVNMMMEIVPQGLPEMGTDTYIRDARVVLPEMFTVASNSNVLELGNLKVSNGKAVAITPVPLTAIHDVDLSNKNEIKGDIKFYGKLFASKPKVNLSSMNSDINAKLNIAVGNGNSIKSPGKLAVSRVRGNVEYHLNESMSVVLADIPDEIKDVELTLNPTLTLDLSTNLGLPARGDIVITPYPHTENYVTIKDITLPYSSNSSNVASKSIVVGREASAKNGDNSTDIYKQDLSKLVSNLPDSLVLEVKLATETDKEAIVEPAADYTFDVGYELFVPLKLEKDTKMSFPDSEIELDKDITKYMIMGSFGIEADVISTLPLGVEIKLSLLDQNDRLIRLEEDSILKIAAANGAEKEKTTSINTMLKIADRDMVSKADKIKLRLEYRADMSSNVQLNENQYLQARNVTLILPEGVTIFEE